MVKSSPVLHWILNSDDLKAHADLVDQFFALYAHPDNFPDENEREEPRFILQRIREGSDNPHTHLIAYTTENRVRGGAIFEYYPRSACCMLTYLFVDKAVRGTGIARQLIETDRNRGIPGLIAHLRAQGRPVRAVFFETNNPFLTPEGMDSMAPADRLSAFYKLGARRVDIDYVQPPLDRDKAPVSNLYLCTFPQLSGDVFLLGINTLLCFLVEFYHSLEALRGDIYHELEKARAWTPGTAPGFATVEIEQMYESLLRNDYAVSGFTYLKQLPRREAPQLVFGRASVCLEILVDESYYRVEVRQGGAADYVSLPGTSGETDPLSAHQQNDRFCVMTHSFETDLLSYAYQSAPPFYTRCFNFPSFREVIVRFPQTLAFVSEGRQEMLYVLADGGEQQPHATVKTVARRGGGGEVLRAVVKEIRLRVFLNYTYFFNSEIRIWHLIFSTVDDVGIDEIDLIKLMKFFSGSQESKTEAQKVRELGKIKFVIPGREDRELDVMQLFEEMSGIRYARREDCGGEADLPDKPSIHAIRNGIVGIDTDYCRFSAAGAGDEQDRIREVLAQLFENLRSNEEGKKVSSVDVQRQYARNKHAEYVFEAFCGITLGIFDYDRMGFEEVSDTLIPRSATENSFLTINRGVLSSFGYGDSVFAASINTIGINPYLQIPSAVLAHNEYVVNDAFARSRTVLEEVAGDESVVDIRKLEASRKQIRHLLNIDFLPNVFQYPTEQDLFEYGLVHRGVLDKRKRTQANLEQIDHLIEESNASLDHRYQFWVNILLMVISIFQIYEVVTSLITEIGGPRLNTFPVLMKLSVLLVLIAICVYIAYRLYRNFSADTGRRFILRR
ncbi:GNAT superfamily N-acetyltransferase [Lewinella aquimaris]|uniref:GNAT superfamily N-acetyltransferase n=1 Tax=Neolewinella aquimaris TaxID=1835722 RepID=A0A840E2Z1_9BACT|nr:GNAT family N-acetyltransferase [Neolewinella aquimaris]MBB4078035.1 GNAT superfamily N-acetyltransferase [Neolewinella aquimaris]